MTRREALAICEEALSKHEGGEAAYLSIVEDLVDLEEYRDDVFEDDKEEDEK